MAGGGGHSLIPSSFFSFPLYSSRWIRDYYMRYFLLIEGYYLGQDKQTKIAMSKDEGFHNLVLSR